MLLLFHQCCCSFFSIAAPPSTLLLLLQCCHFTLMLPVLPQYWHYRECQRWEWWSVERSNLADDLLLWCRHSSVVIAAFPWMLQCPCKNELFSIAGPSNWSLHNRLAIPWSLWSLHPFFDVSTPPQCYHSSSDVAVPAFMLLLLLSCCHFTLMLPFLHWHCHSFFDVPATHLCYCSPLRLPLHLQCPWKYESRIQYLGSKIRGLGSRIQDDQSILFVDDSMAASCLKVQQMALVNVM